MSLPDRHPLVRYSQNARDLSGFTLFPPLAESGTSGEAIGAPTMKQVRFAAFLFMALVVIAGVLLWFGVLTQPIVDAAATQFEASTGYKLSVNGGTSVRFAPSLEVAADDVAITSATGSRRGELLRVGQVQFGISLRALIQGRVDAKEIVLKKPVLRLAAEPDNAPSAARKVAQGDPLENFAFRRVRVEDRHPDLSRST